jgi:hypothetical protein
MSQLGCMGYVWRSLLSLISCLCAAGGVCGAEAVPPDQAAAIYARATNQFAAAIFFKPDQATNAGLPCQLAPLLIQEVANERAPNALLRDQFGSACMSYGPTPGAPSRSALCWAADSVQLNDKTHARISYQWWYASAKPPGPPQALVRQGIRITLGSGGQPACWEILADTTGMRLIFISASLEAAAIAQFGKPVPGRRYAIERGMDQAPNVLVPRVIDDGPLAMGPIVYLSEGTRNVSTLICRCMAAQVKQLIATRSFDLMPLDASGSNAFPATAATTSNALPVSWPGDEQVANRLDHCLRLPAIF